MGEPLSPAQAVLPVHVGPGGAIELRGQWNLGARDLAIDGCQSGPSASATASGAGAFDYAAGGWQLTARDWRAHSCRLAATGAAGEACRIAGVASPCLPSRLRSIANQMDNPMSYEELRQGLSGGLELELLTPGAVVAPSPPEAPLWIVTHAPAVGSVGLALVVAWAGARAVLARRRRPEARVKQTAARVRVRLGGAEPVYRRLVPSVDALAGQASELAALRDRLRARVARADRAALVRRRDELAARGSASPEAAEARGLVEEQLARVDRWQGEAERAQARLDRVLEYLRALDTRLLDEAERAGDAPRGTEDDARLLAELERDVSASLEGAREADRLAAR